MDYTQKYLKYKAKYLSLKNKKSMNGGGNKISVILFKADWCGHCTKFKPIWEAVSKKYNSTYDFIIYDADSNTEKFKEYNVEIALPQMDLYVKNRDSFKVIG